jgi:RHS repeat-associated protein
LTTDALGSPRIKTDANGNIISRSDTLPFGEDLITSQRTQTLGYKPDSVRRKFTTYKRDEETGLDFAESRYYSPRWGRFVSPDEFKGGPDELFDFEEDASNNPTFYADLGNPQSLNKYQYTYNNPLNLTDESGHCPPCWLIGGAIYFILSNPAPTGPRQQQTTAEMIGDVAAIVPIPGGKFVGSTIAKAVIGGVRKTVVNQTRKQIVRQTVKQAPKQSVRQTTKQATKQTPSKVKKSVTTESIGGKFTKKTKVFPSKEKPGQSRAEIVNYRNKAGKVIRVYKDSYDRANKFQHRKPKPLPK